MNRPQALERMLFSIAARQPQASIHVADQSETFDQKRYQRLGARLRSEGLRRQPAIHRLPFDCGVSVARNHLVDSTPSEYKLVVDDDWVFTAETAIEKMARLLDTHPDVGIASGAIAREGRANGEGVDLRRHGSVLREHAPSRPYDRYEGIRLRQVDFAPNFALMRRELFEHVRWDPELKISGEHLDFYLRLRETGYIAVLTPDVSGEHLPTESDRNYKRMRLRGNFFRAMMVKQGLRRIEHLNGLVSELQPDGRLTRGRPGEAPPDQVNS